MSSDNGIYILTTPKGNGHEYRVAHQMAIDNYLWDDESNDYTNDPKVLIKNAREMWKDCKVLTEESEAFQEAVIIYEDVGYTEYGIQFINISEEF
jgi:hypothetical protein